jgi:hypothetical protein
VIAAVRALTIAPADIEVRRRFEPRRVRTMACSFPFYGYGAAHRSRSRRRSSRTDTIGAHQAFGDQLPNHAHAFRHMIDRHTLQLQGVAAAEIALQDERAATAKRVPPPIGVTTPPLCDDRRRVSVTHRKGRCDGTGAADQQTDRKQGIRQDQPGHRQ